MQMMVALNAYANDCGYERLWKMMVALNAYANDCGFERLWI